MSDGGNCQLCEVPCDHLVLCRYADDPADPLGDGVTYDRFICPSCAATHPSDASDDRPSVAVEGAHGHRVVVRR